MKSKLIFTFLIAAGTLIGQEPSTPPDQEYTPSLEESSKTVKQGFGYFSAGLGPFPIPLPAFSGGFRAQSGHNGIDASLQVQTIVAMTELKANLLYHYYPKPSLSSQFYVGGGVGSGLLLANSWFDSNNDFLISPELVFGKQYRNESHDLRFFQMQISFPTFKLAKSHKANNFHVRSTLWFPLTIISYGIGF